MLRVEIEKTEIDEREVATNNGSFISREQKGYLFREDAKYPSEITLQLEEKKPAWAVGEYRISDDSFYVSRYGQIKLRRHLMLLATD
jgi:hypothetical protein